MKQKVWKRWAVLLTVAVSMVGCVPAALVVGATAGGAVLYDKRSMKSMMSDHKADRQLRDTLNRDEELSKSASINVTVYNGIALLVGEAKTEEVKLRASQDVRELPYIKRVYNEVTITSKISGWRKVGDAWLLSKVKMHMLAKPGLQSTNMKVVVNNAAVYLMGSVSHKQATMAANLVRQVSGVKKVVKVFAYE